MALSHASAPTRRTLHRVGALLTATVIAQFLPACGSEVSKATEERPSSTSASKHAAPLDPSSSVDPEAPDKGELLRAYAHFWEEQIKAYSRASLNGTSLNKYATGEALARAEGDLMSLQRQKVVAGGRPVNHAVVTDLDMKSKVPRGTITDCLDVSDWTRIDTKSGNELPVPKERLTRYVTVVSSEKWGQQWMILKVSPQVKTC